jgi:hypothetical protein
MDASRLGSGAVVAVISALIVLLGLFLLDWYSVDQSAIAPVQIERSFLAQLPGASPQVPNDLNVASPPNFSAWDGAGFLGTIANLIILAAALAPLALAFSLARGSPLSEGAPRGLLLLGAAAALMVLLRMLSPPEDHLSLEAGIWLTFAGTLGLLTGALMLRGEAGAGSPRPPRRPPATS